MEITEVEHGVAPGGTAAADTADGDHWREVVGALGGEIAVPLTAALERIQALAQTGRIDKASLRALGREVEDARRAGMAAQQLTRLASTRTRLSQELVTLTDLLRVVLRHRTHETEWQGIVLKPSPIPADVIADPSLLYGLLNAVLDWALPHARSDIEIAVDMTAWPTHARVVCTYIRRLADDAPDAARTAGLDSLAWRLVEQTARTAQATLTRCIDGGTVRLAIEFPRTAQDMLEGMTTVELDQGFGLSGNSRPLAGSHVLIVASRRDMRVRVRDAIRHMGLVIDLVSSVEAAVDFCRDALPHAIIVEGILEGERLRRLRADITSRLPEFPFIEIEEEGASYTMSGFGGAVMGRVGREAIDSALPSVLMYELSRSL